MSDKNVKSKWISKSPIKGFTLVEMLVVMVLLGLISSILFQGLSLIGKVQSRLIPNIQKQQKQMLQERWFRESVSGLMAGVKNTEHFTGTQSGFTGISISPLHSNNRAPQLIEWEIATSDEQYILGYKQQQGLSWQIETYSSESQQPVFVYLDSSGQWHNNWNIRGADSNQAALPEAIALKKESDEQSSWLVATIEGEKSRSWWLIDE